ncbi:MAG TPA: 3D domain-containing protein [Chthoniobacterales bacterium]
MSNNESQRHRFPFKRFAKFLFAAALACLCAGCAETGLDKDTGLAIARRKSAPVGPPRVHWTVKTTAYNHGEAGDGGHARRNAVGGLLQSGTLNSASADWSRYPLGTIFYSPDTGRKYIIDDYGSALVGTDTIDLYMPTMGQMHNWGVRRIQVEVIKWGDRDESLKILRPRARYGYIRRMVASLEKSTERFPKRG